MELFQYVDPIVGTVGDIPNGGIFPNGLPAAGGGKTYPGAVTPWGMVQFSPDTITGGDNGWFGHGGAWGTNCQVNWKERKLKLCVVQLCGQPRPWGAELAKAEEQFFKSTAAGEGDEYVGRMK